MAPTRPAEGVVVCSLGYGNEAALVNDPAAHEPANEAAAEAANCQVRLHALMRVVVNCTAWTSHVP